MKLHDLHPTPGSRRPARRVGRGHGSGRGKTAGRGTKGQKARAGGNIPAWFEGGQTPLHVRTPKLHGFKNRFRVEYAPVNLAKLAEVTAGTLVTPDVLAHDGVISDTKLPVKILGVGDAPKGITIHAHAFSRTALDKLSAAGSTVQRLSWPENLPIEEGEEAEEAEGAHEAAADEAGESIEAEAPVATEAETETEAQAGEAEEGTTEAAEAEDSESESEA